jgi:hypothetical protein
MTIEFLIHAIVRQTTVLIAQIATAGGIRALDAQGISRKVSADMFGMGLRSYLRRIQRLRESSTESGRSLWDAVLTYLRAGDLVTKGQVLAHFHRDDEMQVRGVLHDLTESGLAFCSGTGDNAVYRATSEAELGRLRKLGTTEGIDELLWVVIYREGPLTQSELAARGLNNDAELAAALTRLVDSGRVSREASSRGELYRAESFYVPLNASAGWEAAVLDHFQAAVKTISCRLRGEPAHAVARGSVGGSTYTLDVCQGHPLYDEVASTLSCLRERVGELRQRVEAHNAESALPPDYEQVVVYLGQCILEVNTEEQNNETPRDEENTVT